MSVRYGLARILSKRGVCSRSQASALIQAGRVRVSGKVILDPEFPTLLNADVVLDGAEANPATRVYLMLNKPKGLVVTSKDEKGRATIFDCFDVLPAQHLSPVGRLDQASEGLLLLSNDTEWSARIALPESKTPKLYHVQIDEVISDDKLNALRAGIADGEDFLKADRIDAVRSGQKNCWLEFELTEGKNRQIRRMCASQSIEVLRLIRIQVGNLKLGELKKGAWRVLTPAELIELQANSQMLEG
jgi:23S rRNA pseudouridine2605 synthase